MLSRNLLQVAVVAGIIMLLIGCSQGSTPMTPDIQEPGAVVSPDRPVSSSTNHQSWGLFEVRIEAATGEAEITPLRSAMYHLNTIPFLEKNGHSTMKLADIQIDGSSVELNVGLTHPFPGLYQWSGFDVRGIFISDGTWDEFASNGDLVMSEYNEPRLLNPDGYTRWWNEAEFPGNGTILGYVPGVYGPNYSFGNTINPFKYFSDDLTQNQEFPEDLDFDRRGIFTASSAVNWRHYSLDFGAQQNWYVFNYAVDACHKFSDSYDGSSVPSLGDLPDPFFELDANMPEPFAITVEEAINTLYYASPTEFGGSIILMLNIYDWQGMNSPEGIASTIDSITVESPALIGTNTVPATPAISSSENYSTFRVELTNCHPDDQFWQDILITVTPNDAVTYRDGYDGYDTLFNGDADEPVCAYALYTPIVSPDIPVQTKTINVMSPNGGETWLTGQDYEITWASIGDITSVTIEYSDTGGAGVWHEIDDYTQNDGSFLWDTTGIYGNNLMVRVSDANDIDVNDASDSAFDMDLLTLDFPNGAGDDFTVGASGQYIEWTVGSGTTDTIENIQIQANYDSGGWVTITGAGSVPAGSGQWEWIPTLGDISSNVQVRITSVDDAIYTDTSDGSFEIFEKHELTLDEYKSYFEATSNYTYRGRRTSASGLNTYLNASTTSWDFTSGTLASIIGSSNFHVQTANGGSIPLYGDAPSFYSQEYGMNAVELSWPYLSDYMGGGLTPDPWWIYYFDDTPEILNPSGFTGYFDGAYYSFWLILQMATHQFNLTSTSDIQFPLDADSGVNVISDDGAMYYNYSAPVGIDYSSSDFSVISSGTVTTHAGTFPHCLLIRHKHGFLNILTSGGLGVVGALMWQWVDMDDGTIVAYAMTHNDLEISRFNSTSGQITGDAIVGALY